MDSSKPATALKQVEKLFTQHPEETGETYTQHLKFTSIMSGRIVLCGTILFIHGLFPFTFRHTVSSRIESIYRILKARIPKNRRDEIDLNWDI